MAKTASLTSVLVAKKGEASPASLKTFYNQENSTPDKNGTYYKAMTVKLDRKRYEDIKTIGLKLDKTSQEIFIDAFDAWFKNK